MMHAICTCPKMTRLHRCSPLPFFAPRSFALIWKVFKQTMMLYGYHSRSFPIACCGGSLFAYRLPQGHQNYGPLKLTGAYLTLRGACHKPSLTYVSIPVRFPGFLLPLMVQVPSSIFRRPRPGAADVRHVCSLLKMFFFTACCEEAKNRSQW